MPTRFESVVVSAPGSGGVSTLTEIALPFQGGIVRHFEIVIPAGHGGLTGISLGYGHRGIIPFGVNAFYSGDDDIIRRDYNDQVPGVQWSAFLVNNDLQSHVWEVRMDFDEIPNMPTGVPTPIAPADILAAGAQAMSGT